MYCSGNVLPLQVIFWGETTRCLPKGQQDHQLGIHGWHLTFTPTHWSNLEKMQEYARNIFLPYVQSVYSKEGLDFQTQHSVLLIDCYFVGKYAVFLEWMKEKHILIHVLFVCGNCTSKLQPCNVVLLLPFKAKIHKQFSQFVVHVLVHGISGHKAFKSK